MLEAFKERWVGLLVVVLVIMIGGTGIVVETTIDHLLSATDHLLTENATNTARIWAQYLAANVPDLEQIGSGEQPSTASMTFFNAGRKINEVFRYKIFNREGYSQLVSTRDHISPVDISEFSPEAARTIATRLPVIDTKEGQPPDLPAYYAEAFVPVFVGDRVVAVVAAYVDQTEEQEAFYHTLLIAAVALRFVC